VPEKTFEFLFPIDSPKGILGFCVVHFHQIQLVDLDTARVECFLELVRGFYFKQIQVANTTAASKKSSSAPKVDNAEENESSSKDKKIDLAKIKEKIGGIFKWKKAS
jgi:hypothetical protein